MFGPRREHDSNDLSVQTLCQCENVENLFEAFSSISLQRLLKILKCPYWIGQRGCVENVTVVSFHSDKSEVMFDYPIVREWKEIWSESLGCVTDVMSTINNVITINNL